MEATTISTTDTKAYRPSEKYKAGLAEDQKVEDKMTDGIEYLNADQDRDQKENMRPDGENSRLVRQGRMNPKNGSDCSTSKTRKCASFFPNKNYWNNFDLIVWDE